MSKQVIDCASSKMVSALSRMSCATTPLFINDKFVCELSIAKAHQLEDKGVIVIENGIARKRAQQNVEE